MTRSLRIAVADDEEFIRDYYRETLAALGHEVVAVAETGRRLVEQCAAARPDLVITDIKMPDLDGIAAAAAVCRQAPVPVILVSAYHDQALLERARDEHIVAYLIKPVKQAELETAIALTVWRFEQFQALRREAADLRQALEDRKLLERAKGLIMKRARLDEPEAHRRLQQLARDHNKKLAEVARTLLAVEDMYQPRPTAGAGTPPPGAYSRNR